MRLRSALPFAAALAALGCAAESETASPCGAATDLSLSALVPTVATVRWEACFEDSAEAWVAFGIEGQELVSPAARDDDGWWEAVLLGAKAGSEIGYRPVEVHDGEEVPGEAGAYETGAAPPGLPKISVEGTATPGFLAAPLLTEPPAYVILDSDGDYVWWYQELEGFIPGLFRVAMSRDGRSLLFQPPSGGANYHDLQDVVRMSYDGTQVETYPGSHRGTHEFVELPGGSIGLLRTETREVDGRTIHGDRLLEVGLDGSEVAVWTVWDWAEHDPEVFTEEEYGGDWSHANAVDFDEARGVYHVSLRNFGEILTIDRATGEVVEVFGGAHSDYTDAAGGTAFTALQHQFEILDGGLLIHDNDSADSQASRAVEYALDPATGEAELVWEYFPDPPYYNYALGDVARLPSGHTLVTWSMGGQVDEVSPDGDLVWRANVELGAGIGYVTWLERLQ